MVRRIYWNQKNSKCVWRKLLLTLYNETNKQMFLLLNGLHKKVDFEQLIVLAIHENVYLCFVTILENFTN